MDFRAIWARLPVIVKAVVGGLLTLAAATLPWQLLFIANVRFAPSVPWAVPVMGFYLVFYWRYLAGRGRPSVSRAQRKKWLRSSLPNGRVWLWSLIFGASVTAALFIALFGVVGRFVPLPRDTATNLLPHVPDIVLLSWFIMTSLVAGVAEEGVFRGHMQSRIAERHGILPAAIIVGIMFGLAHGFGNAIFFGYYFVLSLAYSAIVYFARSILPVIVLHSVWDFSLFVWTWKGGIPRVPRPVAEVGFDSNFWLNVTLSVALGIAAVWAVFRLAQSGKGIGAKDLSVVA